MTKYSKIKITSTNITILKFINILKIIAKKRKILLVCQKLKEKEKKYTILKSPHVNKKARDQIKTKTIEHIIKFKNYKNFNFFYYFFSKKNNTNSNLSFNLFVKQKYVINN